MFRSATTFKFDKTQMKLLQLNKTKNQMMIKMFAVKFRFPLFMGEVDNTNKN